MAKRKKPAAAKHAKRGNAKAAATKAKHKLPKRQTLPGMEGTKDEMLETLARDVAETRDSKNELIESEKRLLSGIKVRMHEIGEKIYAGYGMEFALVPGDEKLRVRRVKSEGDGATDAGDEDDVESDE